MSIVLNEAEKLIENEMPAEPEIKKVIVRRKGSKASELLCSIAESAKANKLKPYEYFKHLLTELVNPT